MGNWGKGIEAFSHLGLREQARVNPGYCQGMPFGPGTPKRRRRFNCQQPGYLRTRSGRLGPGKRRAY
jgi:hypothetical protein